MGRPGQLSDDLQQLLVKPPDPTPRAVVLRVVFPTREDFAGPAGDHLVAVRVHPDVSIKLIQLMAMNAVAVIPAKPSVAKLDASVRILARRDYLKVIRIDAAADATKMIDVHALGDDRASIHYDGKAVRTGSLAVGRSGNAVAVSVHVGDPDPATAVLLRRNLFPIVVEKLAQCSVPI